MKTIRIEFNFMPPVELRGNGRPAHWAVRHRKTKQLKEATYFRLLETAGEPYEAVSFEKAAVRYEVHYCGLPIDRDNIIKGMKPALDAFVDWLILLDDSPEYVTDIRVDYVRVKHRNDIKVVMEIQEVETNGNANAGTE